MGSEYKLSRVYPQSKPFMDDNGRRKLPQKRAAASDLRVHTLTQEAAKRQRPLQPHGCYEENQQAVLQQQGKQPTTDKPIQEDRPAATDFSGFLKQLKPHQRGSQQLPGHAGSRQQQGQQQQVPEKSPGGLDRLLTQNSLHAEPTAVHELNNMMSLDRSFPADASRDGIFKVPAAPDGSSAQAAAAAAGTGPGRNPWHLRSLEQIPWDWSVKSRVKLGSAAPFVLLQEQAASDLAADCAAMSAGSRCKHTAEVSSQERLSQLLMQWQHPAAPMSSAMMAALRTDRDGAASLTSRVTNWQQAFRSAYAAVRHGHCPLLYVVGQAFRQNFSVVFCAPGVMGYQGLHAVVSRSNKPLRSHLASMGCHGIQAGTLEVQQQGQQNEKRAAHAAASFDGQPGSQLLLAGTLQVQCLHAALLTLPWCESEQPDVPLISAPVQFMYAQMCPLRLQALPDSVLDQLQQQQQQQQQGQVQQAGVQPLHYAQLTGCTYIMPWTAHRLMQLLLETQAKAGFDVWLDTEVCHSSINVLPGMWQQAAAAARRVGGVPGCNNAATAISGQKQQHWKAEELGFATAEVLQWESSSVLLQGRVLRQLRVFRDTGEVAARLA